MQKTNVRAIRTGEGMNILHKVTHLIDTNSPLSINNTDDLSQIVELFKNDYGDHYIDDTVYEPDLIRHANISGALRSLVVRENGHILGHLAIIRIAPNAPVFQFGQAIVGKAGRGRGVMGALVNEALRLCQSDPYCRAVYAVSVTHHLASQRTVARHGFIDTAFLYGVLPPGMIKADSELAAAHSCIVQFKVLRVIDPYKTVFVPDVYRDQVAASYSMLGQSGINVSAADVQSNREEHTDANADLYPRYGIVSITVQTAGADLAERVADIEQTAVNQEIRISNIYLDITDKNTIWAAKTLRKVGYFYAGLFPCFGPNDQLVLQRDLATARTNSSFINSKAGRELQQFCESDHIQIVPVSPRKSNTYYTDTGNAVIAEPRPPSWLPSPSRILVRSGALHRWTGCKPIALLIAPAHPLELSVGNIEY